MQKNSRNISFLVGILLSLILFGYLTSCTLDVKSYRLYQGPQLPSDETAQIICTAETIRMNSINGQKSPDGKDTFGNVKLEILPGDYEITVSFSGTSLDMAYAEDGRYTYTIYYRHDSVNDIDIAINAKPGHTYLVNSTHNFKESRWYIVVKDETAGRRILKEGPYPLKKIRTGDNRQARIQYRN